MLADSDTSCVVEVDELNESLAVDEYTEGVTDTSSIATHVATGVAVIAFVSGVLPLHTMWIVINQYQLYLLIPLIGVYLPDDLLYYIRGQEFSFLSLKSYGFDKFSITRQLDKGIGFEQPNHLMMNIDIENGSMVVNCTGPFAILFIALFVHISSLIVVLILKA